MPFLYFCKQFVKFGRLLYCESLSIRLPLTTDGNCDILYTRGDVMPTPVLQGDMFRAHVKNTYRILSVALLGIMMFLMLISYISDAKMLMLVWAIPFLLFAVYFIFRLPTYEKRYYIEEDAVIITKKSGKIIKMMPFCDVKAVKLAEVGVYRFSYGQYIILLSPKSKDNITPWLRGERWFSRKDIVCLPYTREISHYIYQKTGIVMMMPK